MSDVIERPKRETITKPPGKWRNKWRARSFCMAQNRKTGVRTLRDVGEEFFSETVWPTKEIAEEKAFRCIAESRRSPEYLGAFPEGETP